MTEPTTKGLPDFGTQTSTRSAPPPTLASARQRRRCPLRRFAAPDPAPLDVERLARALRTYYVRRWVAESIEPWVDTGFSGPGYATTEEMAAAIAREYARLEAKP
jgi:hypothetical protein